MDITNALVVEGLQGLGVLRVGDEPVHTGEVLALCQLLIQAPENLTERYVCVCVCESEILIFQMQMILRLNAPLTGTTSHDVMSAQVAYLHDGEGGSSNGI